MLHNTVASTQPPTASSIEWRFNHTDVDVVNNLVTDRLWDRGGTSSLAGNLTYQPLNLFVDGTNGDLHLVSSATVAIDQVTAPVDVTDDIDGDGRPIGPAADVGADEYGMPAPTTVADLRITQAITGAGNLTTTLAWTAPSHAVTYTLRHSDGFITAANWPAAVIVTVPFTAANPGTAESFTTTVPLAGDRLFFALKSQNLIGTWSGVSNNAVWPYLEVYLPLVLK